MKIVVTGGLGFIGSSFIRRMIALRPDVEITNLDNMSYGSNPASLEDIAGDPRYNFLRGSITNPDAVSRALEGADVVMNFAAETHVDRSIANPAPFLRTNILGVFTLLESIRNSRTEMKFLQVGTDEVYGDAKRGSFSEDSNLSPSSPYSATKAAADHLIHAYHETYGLKTLITRCTNNFGPYQFPEKLIPKTIIRALHNQRVPLYGRGRQVRDWLFVEDHCEALEIVVRRGRPGRTYNVAGQSRHTNLAVVSMILGVLRKPTNLINHVVDRPGHDFRYSLDDARIRRELGWKPRHNFSKALTETVNWYAKNEWWWRPIAGQETLAAVPWKRSTGLPHPRKDRNPQ
jgi:dTDP-glucose 4,6-dehydratase